MNFNILILGFFMDISRLQAFIENQHSIELERINREENSFVKHLLLSVKDGIRYFKFISFFQEVKQKESKDLQEMIFPLKSYGKIQTVVGFIPYFDGNILLTTDQVIKATHEIGHMVETKFERIFLKDWGMLANTSSNKKHISVASLSREQRVVALEGIMTDNFDVKKLRRYSNPRWNLYEQGNPFFTSKKHQDEWVDNITEYMFKHWNKDRIESEWFRRINVLKQDNQLRKDASCQE